MAKRFELLIHQMLDDSDNYSRPTADAEPQLDQQVFAERLADAITLLSQPAVAQTEAGNDMTARESKDSARLDWLEAKKPTVEFLPDPASLRPNADACWLEGGKLLIPCKFPTLREAVDAAMKGTL